MAGPSATWSRLRTAAVFALTSACHPCADADRGSSPEPPLATCETACNHLGELGCPEAVLVPGGTTCPTACRRAEQLVDLRLGCIVTAADVAAVRACGTVRCQR